MHQGFAPNKETTKAGQKQPLCAAIDAPAIQQQWQSQFAALEDPRGLQGVEHPFLSIVDDSDFSCHRRCNRLGGH
jgi:heat shock protein HslJ